MEGKIFIYHKIGVLKTIINFKIKFSSKINVDYAYFIGNRLKTDV